MDEDTASKFVSSLVKSIQSLCNGYIEFASSIEVIGHIHVNIDRNLKFNYVLSEEVNKSRSEAATVFSSHSYHSKPPPSAVPSKPAAAQSDTDRSHRKSHGSRPDEVDPRVPSQPNFSPASRDSFTSGRSDDDGVQTTSSRSRESESSRSPATHTQDSLDRRRKMRSETRTSGNSEPVLKRSRPSGPSSVTFPKEEYEVIEVKEEPDDDDSACLYGNNKSGQSGRGMQDISQPDFSNLVAESLDRVGQHEGTPLMGGNMQHLGEEPFPVTLLHNQAAGQAAPVGLSPGDPQASTSGGFARPGLLPHFRPTDFMTGSAPAGHPYAPTQDDRQMLLNSIAHLNWSDQRIRPYTRMSVACLDFDFSAASDKIPSQDRIDELSAEGLGVPSSADRRGKVQFENGLSAAEFQQRLCELFPRLIMGSFSLCQATKGRVLQYIPNWQMMSAERMKRVLLQGRLYITPSALRPGTNMALSSPPVQMGQPPQSESNEYEYGTYQKPL